MNDSTVFVNKLNMRLIYHPKLVTPKYGFYQFDYIFIPIHMNSAIMKNTFFNATFITRAAIILISTPNSRFYFANTAKATMESSSGNLHTLRRKENYKWYFILQVPLIRLDKELRYVQTYYKVMEVLNKFSFEMIDNFPAEVCPLETIRTSRIYYSHNWTACAKNLFRSKLNCSSILCKLHVRQFHIIEHGMSEENIFVTPHGSTFHGPVYSMFYLKGNSRNIFSLLSPFTLNGWIVLMWFCYVVTFVLWLLNIGYNPIFWLLTVIIEQNNDQRGKLNQSSLPLILAWLYVAIVLRQAYTSNLYDCMTFEETPSDLPDSFQKCLQTTSVVLLSSFNAIDDIYGFRSGIDQYGTSNHSNAKRLITLI